MIFSKKSINLQFIACDSAVIPKRNIDLAECASIGGVQNNRTCAIDDELVDRSDQSEQINEINEIDPAGPSRACR